MGGSPIADRTWTSPDRTTPVPHAGGHRWPLLLAGVLPLAVFALQGHIGLGKADEGFLWYGSQRVLAGEVPLRDFQSYDIGRYYWAAAWMWLLDSPGLVAMRFANSVLAACTVVLATMLVATAPRVRPAWIALAAVTFAVWMVPEYKAADSFAAILLIAGLARLIRDPGPRGAATFGACLGLAATIGINHALYGTIGGVLGYAFLLWHARRPIRRDAIVALCAGTLAGYAPVLACHLFVPGFTAAFVDGIRLLFEAGTTNVAIPVPSPLAVFRPGQAPFVEALRASSFASLYYAAPWLVALGLWRLVRQFGRQVDGRRGQALGTPRGGPPMVQRSDAVFAAAVLLAIPYAHYVYSSAGTMHLAVSGLPFVVAAWTFPAADGPSLRLVRIALLPLSLFFFLHAYAGYPLLRGRPLTPVVVMGDALRVPPGAAAELHLLTRLASSHPGRRFFAAHDWPGAYAVLGQRAPNWEILELFTSRPERQRREIERLKAADIAFVILTTDRPGSPPDGLEKTHPDIARYVRACFRLAESIREPVLTVDVLDQPRPHCDAA